MTGAPEDDVGEPPGEGVEEYVPDLLMPAYDRYRAFDRFRESWGPTVVYYGEIAVTILLAVGFVYWLYLYVVVG